MAEPASGLAPTAMALSASLMPSWSSAQLGIVPVSEPAIYYLASAGFSWLQLAIANGWNVII